jgi:hypothetical protein
LWRLWKRVGHSNCSIAQKLLKQDPILSAAINDSNDENDENSGISQRRLWWWSKAEMAHAPTTNMLLALACVFSLDTTAIAQPLPLLEQDGKGLYIRRLSV